MQEQFMQFWNLVEFRNSMQQKSRFSSLNELKAYNPVAAVVDPDNFEDWTGLTNFLMESNTKLASLECRMGRGAFNPKRFPNLKDEGFLKAATDKLDCLTVVMASLCLEEMESLRSAFLVSSKSPALRLRYCYWDPPELIPSMVSYLKRLQIGPETSGAHLIRVDPYHKYHPLAFDWWQFGEALKQPSSTLCDLSLIDIQSSLDWLADALESQHCKLRRLALIGVDRMPKRLLQVLQTPSCRLEGFEISTSTEDIPEKELLAEALKASASLWFFQTTFKNCSRFLLYEGILKAQKISHLVLWAENGYKLSAAMRLIPDFLSSPGCRLQSFVALFPGSDINLLLVQNFQEVVLTALEGNYHSQLQELHLGPLTSKSLQQRRSNLLYRNKLSKDSPGKFVKEFSQPPQVLKLFTCGHSGVGKTTITTNLLRSVAVPMPAFLQRHASTQGISLRNLEIGDKNLVIFDLAGQEVYHAFHHYFIRRSENDLFLIVCKLDKKKSEDPQQNRVRLQRLLTYWLRFIVSHQSVNAQSKPKVCVVLNHFCKPGKLEYNALKAVKNVLERFGTKVDLMGPVLEVVALKPRQLFKLKENLKLAAEATAQQLPMVPKICNDFIQKKHKLKQSMEKTVFQLDELKKWLPDTADEPVDEVTRTNTLKFTLMCLHNMGEAIYFGSAEDASELENHAILDVPWFIQEVIGKFIPKLPRNDDHCGNKAVIDIDSLHENLRKLVRPDQKDPQSTVIIIVRYLEAMGLIIPHWEASDSIIVQTLLKNKFPGWQEEKGTTYSYWGRRMQPRDRETTLLPSGVFATFQANIARLCKGVTWQNQRSLLLGDGWISFNKSSVKVLVLIGGENHQWTDRQWVDIMLMVPEDNIQCVEAERILSSIRDCTRDLQQACPYLRTEEHVLNPKQVKTILHGSPNTGMQTKLLDELKHIEGLVFHWDPNDKSSIGELLMLSELKHLFDSRQSVVDDFNSIAPVYDLEQTAPALPEFENPDMRKLAEYLAGHFQQLEVSMQNMLDTLHKMECSLKFNQGQILNSLSKMLQHIQVPKFPYFTDEKNSFLKYSSLVGTRVWIHYMCESGELKHRVEDNTYKGVAIIIAHDWIKKYTTVLVPAIMVSFLIAKVGTTAAGIPLKDVLDVAEERLKTTINSCFGYSIDIRQPAEHEVEEVLEHVKKAAGEQNLKVLMAKSFGLFFHRGAWVCDKHRL